MTCYKVPETAEERISDFNRLFEEFKQERSIFVEKQKKVSGHRARKALLSIAKLSRFIRKDFQDVLRTLTKTEKAKQNT